MARPRMAFARVGPVHFQPLELELEHLGTFIRGAVINAGCGQRDISPLLSKMGATSVVNADFCDLRAQSAVRCDLAMLPFGDRLFDTVLCNAVLEHVNSLEGVMKELVRVLRPGGNMILAIPFMQPFHQAPTDFRRFTSDGMRQLGDQYGLRTVALYPVHTIAQTLGWISWEYLVERDNRFLKAVFWPVIWAATRYNYRTNTANFRTANTLQGVYTKSL